MIRFERRWERETSTKNPPMLLLTFCVPLHRGDPSNMTDLLPMNALNHLTDDDLDEYMLKRMYPEHTDAAEVHLLMCGRCAERLGEHKLIARAVRTFGDGTYLACRE